MPRLSLKNKASQKVLEKIKMKYDEKTVHYDMNLLDSILFPAVNFYHRISIEQFYY